MNESSKKVLNYLTGDTDIDDVSVEDLQKLVIENPYFPISQLLLAEKFKRTNDNLFTQQSQKASLYFSNPYWLKYQLTDEYFSDNSSKDGLPGKIINNNSQAAEQPGILTQASSSISQLSPTEDNIEKEALVPDDSSQTNAEPIYSTSKTSVEPIVEQVEKEQAIELRNTDVIGDHFIQNLAEGSITNDSAINGILPVAAETENEVIELKEAMAGTPHNTHSATEDFLEEATTDEKGITPDDEHDRMFKNIKAMLDATSEEAGADVTDTFVPMDPYYTIDYFASQGIKLELDLNPQDKLGQNLKKFTHWLRHMKKLGPEDAVETINKTETEADIQQIADSSNTVREVVTEAMATVLEKQGKKDKAIELYNKLSFLNPHKRAYFADKIKILKGI